MADHALDIAPGAIVVVRDEQWLVSSVEQTADGDLLTVRGVSELVKGTTAQLDTSIGTVTTAAPASARVVACEQLRSKCHLFVHQSQNPICRVLSKAVGSWAPGCKGAQ